MADSSRHPEKWLTVTEAGLFCAAGDFYIDPVRPVDQAVITHGHADHARPNQRKVLATQPTLDIMKHRYKDASGTQQQALPYGEVLRIGEVYVSLIPAGHILGSSQVVLEHAGWRVIVSGDYKRRPDPTCAPFTPLPCDIFITEATFGLPVFRHPHDMQEIGKLLHALRLYDDRCVLVGAYALGKCQRIIALLRQAGYHEPIYLHGTMVGLCDLYREHGVELGELIPVAGLPKETFQGKIILAPPSALHDRWSRRLPDPVTAMASGWMRVRARARQKLVDLPLIISDHADWDELLVTLRDVQASEIWVTHGREDALVYQAQAMGLKARPLDISGYEDDEE